MVCIVSRQHRGTGTTFLPLQLPWHGARKMELSGPTIVTPTRVLPAAHTGKTGGAVDPFFTNVRSELSDKGFLVATADNLISWARTGSLMWMQFGLACCAIEM